ncbi:hypothetical protein [Amycolatopsis plumensis]|uniref:hypothetical protein n=1 Tax=Amycolatopsis plumensis TaxID=236508 RepID=UPI00361F0E9A
MLNGLLAFVLGTFVSCGALRALATGVEQVRRGRVLRRRGRTAIARIVSLADLDPECSTLQAVVRFQVEPDREVVGTTYLDRKGSSGLVADARVRIRYDPAIPTILAAEAGGRPGYAEIRQAVVGSVLMVVMVLPTSIYLVCAGVYTVLS